MFFYLTFAIASSVVAFLYPGYASYKTLSQRPASEEDLERWLMYWSALGCIVGFEYVAEWLVSWIPMYNLMKTLLLLYLVLPQTRGSSYIYINHLQPFLHLHESQIDATLASFKARMYTFIQDRLRALWDQFTGALRQQQYQPSAFAAAGGSPSLADPVSGPAQLVAGLWRSYGPSLLASGAVLLTQGAADKAWQTPASSQIHLDPSHSTRDHKHLAKAGPQVNDTPAVSVSFEASSHHSSDSELRRRRGFEEAEERSDGEGDEVDTVKKTSGLTGWFGLGS